MQITRTDILILAFLHEQPSHAWEIDSELVKIGAHLWVEYSRPHLYYSLKKLMREGLVELIKSEKRELKKQYRLTSKGKNTLQKNDAIAQLFHNRVYFDFDLLLGMADRFAGGGTKFKAALEERQEAIQKELEETQDIWQKAEAGGNITFGRAAVMKHRIKFLKSELEYLKWLEKNTPYGWGSLTREGGA